MTARTNVTGADNFVLQEAISAYTDEAYTTAKKLSGTGIVGMNQKKFVSFNIIGSVAWVFSMLFSGHFLQKWILSEFGFDLKNHLEIIVLGIVFFTTAPVIIKLFFGKSNKA